MNRLATAFTAATTASTSSSDGRLTSPRLTNPRPGPPTDSNAPSPTELNFPHIAGSSGSVASSRRYHTPESLYDDPRSPYLVEPVGTFETPPPQIRSLAQRQLQGQLSSSSSLGSSSPASWDDPLPFPTRSPASSSEGNPSSAIVARASALGPDRYVRGVVTTRSGLGGGGRFGRVGGGGRGEGKAIYLGNVAGGPAGSGLVAVTGNEALRILRVGPHHTSSTQSSPSPHPSSSSSNVSASSPYSSPARSIATGPGGYKLDEIADLWKGLPGGLGNAVVNDVQWGVGAFENKILTAMSNGNFCVFDVVRGRFEREIQTGHSRSMLCIEMSKVPDQGYRVITGGADRYANHWDLRQQSHKQSQRSFRHPSPITSLSFSPPTSSAANSYVLGLDNGSIFRYEWRTNTRSVGKVVAAHGSKGVTALEWKGGDDGSGAGWLASGGLDRTVKIWDMSNVDFSVDPYHVLSTPHPVRRVAWRPSHSTELAVLSVQNRGGMEVEDSTPEGSSSQDSETSAQESRLEVWDVRRGFIGKYVLGRSARFGPVGVANDIVWADGSHGNAIQACYSNGAFVQHDMRKHHRPLDDIPRQAVGWSPKGELVFSADKWVKGEIPFDDIYEHWHNLEKVGIKHKTVSDLDFQTKQVSMSIPDLDGDVEAFAYIAQNTRLHGMDDGELCEWNARVVESTGNIVAAQVWRLVQQFIEHAPTTTNTESQPTPLEAGPSKPAGGYGQLTSAPTSKPTSPQRPRGPSLGAVHSPIREERRGSSSTSSGSATPPLTARPPLLPPKSGLADIPSASPLAGPAMQLAQEDAVSRFKSSTSSPLVDDGSGSRSDGGATTRPSPVLKGTPATAPNPPSRTASMMVSLVLDKPGVGNITAKNGRVDIRGWGRTKIAIIRSLLEEVVEQGDVQTAAMVLSLTGATVGLSSRRRERIVMAYVDLLERNRLFSAAASVRLHCGIESIMSQTQTDTLVHTRCSRCTRAIESWEADNQPDGYWYCQICKRAASRCVVCSLVIRGAQHMCSNCGHGAHMECIQDFFARNHEIATFDILTPLARPASIRSSFQWNSSTSERSLESEGSSEGQMVTPVGVGLKCPAGCGCGCWSAEPVLGGGRVQIG